MAPLCKCASFQLFPFPIVLIAHGFLWGFEHRLMIAQKMFVAPQLEVINMQTIENVLSLPCFTYPMVA